jgi:hypothetical protein
MRRRLLPIRSLIIPEGISRNILLRNHAETTSPTSTPEESRLFAKIGRKEEGRLIPIMMAKPTNTSCQKTGGVLSAASLSVIRLTSSKSGAFSWRVVNG